MVSRALGELLLRPSTFIRTSAPHIHRVRRTALSWTVQRTLSSTAHPAAQPAKKEEDYDLEEQPQQPPARQASQNDASQAIDSLISGMPTSRPPAYAPRTQSDSSDELRAARANHTFGSNFSDGQSRRPPHHRPPGLVFDDMALSDSQLHPSLSNKPSDATSLAVQQEETFANYPRLNPTYGRTVVLDASRGRDIVRGIGMLGSLMARNKVKADFNKQRFHERGGLKRKRLASERWRARFKKGFQEITGRVSELTRKGW